MIFLSPCDILINLRRRLAIKSASSDFSNSKPEVTFTIEANDSLRTRVGTPHAIPSNTALSIPPVAQRFMCALALIYSSTICPYGIGPTNFTSLPNPDASIRSCNIDR